MSGGRDEQPRERPVAVLLLGLVIGVLLLVVVLWVLLPDSPLVVVVLGVVVLAAVGFGLWRLLALPQFSRTPERRPAPPRDESERPPRA